MATSASAPQKHWLPLLATLLLGMTSQALAQGTSAQREACTPDALKLCSDTIPDIEKTTACMKRHEAELSPRCHAVFNVPAGTPTEISRSRARATETRKRQAADEREERRLRPDRRRTTRSAPPDADDTPPGAQDRRGGPSDEDGGADIRRFAPGDGTDDGRFADGGPPDGYGPPDNGPRYLAPAAPDASRFAYGDSSGEYDAPGPDRYGPPGSFGPPDDDDDHYGYGAPDARGAPPGRAHRRARTAIAHLCESGEIDARTCAVTLRALKQRREE